jgi:hypothetical protein
MKRFALREGMTVFKPCEGPPEEVIPATDLEEGVWSPYGEYEIRRNNGYLEVRDGSHRLSG